MEHTPGKGKRKNLTCSFRRVKAGRVKEMTRWDSQQNQLPICFARIFFRQEKNIFPLISQLMQK